MRRAQLIPLSVALAVEILFCASLNFFDQWTLEAMPVKFVAAAMAGGIAYFFAASIWERGTLASLRVQGVILWGVAIVLRVAVLPLAPGDDLWRYQWEGKIQHAGFNPYVNAPDDPKLEKLRENFPEWNKINHRDFSAIYPPGAELIFAGMSRISDRPWFYKLLFAAADLVTITVLIRLIGGASRYASVAWYAWNPLVVYCFAGAAHFDSLMILPMTAGILFLVRSNAATDPDRKWRCALAAAALFGIAISIKLVPTLLLLTCVFALGWRAITLLLSVGIPAALSLLYGYPQVPILESLGRFAHVTRLNDLFWWLIEETVWPNPHQKNYHYNVILIACVLAVSLLFGRNWRRGLLWALGTALILSPVLHPWYCTWILPLATWRRALTWHVLSVTIFAYFLFWNERLFALPWHAEPWMRAIIIVPTLAAAALFGWRKQRAAEVSTAA
ncbi:MAG: hypothetical protein ABJB09_00930 [Verrucomicrobiota bacterium]